MELEVKDIEDFGVIIVSKVYWNNIPTPLELRWYAEDKAWSVWMRIWEPDGVWPHYEYYCLIRGLPLRAAKRWALNFLRNRMPELKRGGKCYDEGRT